MKTSMGASGKVRSVALSLPLTLLSSFTPHDDREKRQVCPPEKRIFGAIWGPSSGAGFKRKRLLCFGQT